MGLGGGIYCDSGSIKANNLKIRNNRSGGNDGGGGIYATNSDVILDNCEIINNYTVFGDYFCGGVYFSNINFIIENSKIENNNNTQLFIPYTPIAVGIFNSDGSFKNTIINDKVYLRNSNIKYNNCIINGVIYP
jgi:predicted outer membrane repeat protein